MLSWTLFCQSLECRRLDLQYDVETRGPRQQLEMYKKASLRALKVVLLHTQSSFPTVTSDTKATLARIPLNLNSASRHLAQDNYFPTENMSQASSSTAQNRPYKPKIPELNAEHKIIVTICCFWASIDTGPVAGNASFANSMRQYLGARFNLWLDPPSLLRYYGLIPTVLNRKAQVHDEEMIGHAIALLTQNEKQFDKILEFPIVSRNDIP